MSADGCKLAATTSSAHVFTSADHGQDWQTNPTVNNRPGHMASSADGTKLIIAGAGSSGSIYSSSSSGAHWASNQVAA